MRILPIAFALTASLALGVVPGCKNATTTTTEHPDLTATQTQLDLSLADLTADLTPSMNADFSDGTIVPGIACGTTPCAANAQLCCTNNTGETGVCYNSFQAVNCGDASFYCDGPEDCAPATPYCCVQNGVSQCGDNACGGTVEFGYGMCHTDGDCTKVGGGACCGNSSGSPYKLCLGSATCP